MLGNRRSDFKFSDSQMQFNHDIRVWICGTEVTEHLRGSVSLRRGDRNGPTTLQFDLDNVKDIFVITPANKGYIEENGNYQKDPNAKNTDISSNLTDEAKKRINKIYDEIDALEEELTKAENECDERIIQIDLKYDKEVKETQTQLELAGQQGSTRKIESLTKKLTQEIPDKREQEKDDTLQKHFKKTFDIQNKLDIARKRSQRLLGNVQREKDGFGNYKYTTDEIGTFNSNRRTEDAKSTLTRAEWKTVTEEKKGKNIKKRMVDLKSEEIIFKKDIEQLSDHMYSDSAKKAIYTNKVILNANINVGNIIKDGGVGFKAYPLLIDTPIIEKHDPIRVFIKDPSSPFLTNENTMTDKEKWIPLFTGFVDSVSDHSDYVNGDKFLSISCYDIRGMMQRMRVMTNPRISRGTDTARERGEAAKKFSVNTGYFTDFFAQSGLGGVKSTKYLNFAFDQVCLEFLTGRWHHYDEFANTYVGTVVSSQSNSIIDNTNLINKINMSWKNGDREPTRPSLNGIGTFIPGIIMECPRYDIDKEECIRVMELWYDILVFGVKGTYYTSEEMEYIGCSTIPYGEFDPYNCFVHMITPPKGTPARGLFDSQLEDLQTGFDYCSRFEFLSQLTERLDYQWFTNSMGDIVIEFPMYDFTPEVFGAYKDMLTVNNHLVSTALNEVADTVYSAVSVSGGIQSITGSVQMPITPMCYTAFAKSDQLAYKYGINIMEHPAPNLRTDTGANKLRNQAIVELIKANVAVSTMEMEIAYRPALFPNKPIYNAVNHRMATISGFSYTMQINESVNCTIDTVMVKKKNEDNSFIGIFNAPNMPIKYLGTNAIDISALQSGIDAFYIDADGKPANDIQSPAKKK